jgi:hypothetical protein
MNKRITNNFILSLFLSLNVFAQIVDGEFLTNINNNSYEVTIAIKLQSGNGTAGVLQIEFTYNSTALDFPSSPVKNTDYILFGDFDQYITQNITKPNSNSIRLSLFTLGNPAPVPIDTARTLVIKYFLNITDPQNTSNLEWTQTDVAPEFLQQNYQIGNWANLNEPLSNVTGLNNNFIPSDFNLFQNYPNPFNPSTTIRFSLPQQTSLKINIYNMLGELVETIAEGIYEAGFHKVTFSAKGGSSLPSGAYIYRIESSDFVQTLKMLLLK